MLAGVPAFIVGFSLGGNFALRIARRCRREPIDNLRHVFCISPVLDPEKATAAAIDYLKELHGIFGDWSTVLSRGLARRQA